MPKKSRLENILFTLVMAFVMVYAMVCYNIAIDKGGMTNEVFLLAFRLVNPKEDKPVFVTLAICSMIVCLMCPVMSLIATVLFAHPGNQVIAVWLQKFALNFPMALCWQIFFGGVFVRNLFTWVKKAIHHK